MKFQHSINYLLIHHVKHLISQTFKNMEEAPHDQYKQAQQDLLQNGVCILRGVIPQTQINQLREALEEVFSRDATSQLTVGARSNMTKAANTLKLQGKGNTILEEPTEIETGGKYLTELEVGRWNKGVRHFEHNSTLPAAVAKAIGETEQLHFYMDHIFLKEAGSKLKTAWHQDAPYFPFDCNANSSNPVKAAVCWVPVDAVAANSGGMHYVKGSHKWQEYAPNVLITNQPIDKNSQTSSLPDIDQGAKDGIYEIIKFTNVKPGDVIIHHPNCVHGSGANVSASKRRLAASLRYVGSETKWKNKSTNPSSRNLAKQWEINRQTSVLTIGTMLMRRLMRRVGLLSDENFYEDSYNWVTREMKDGYKMNAIDSARVAFPVVWSKKKEKQLLVNDKPEFLRSKI